MPCSGCNRPFRLAEDYRDHLPCEGSAEDIAKKAQGAVAQQRAQTKAFVNETDRVALIDLDGTVADYDAALRREMHKLEAPGEAAYGDRYTGGLEPPHIENRRKMIQRQPGFWRNLDRLELGFDVVNELRELGFMLHVLTKGPSTTPTAWSEKVEWCQKHLPDAVVTVTGDKSLVYGRVLVDDFPPYFTRWLSVRARGLIVCVAHPWNVEFAKGGSLACPNILRYDGSTSARSELRELATRAYERSAREAL